MTEPAVETDLRDYTSEIKKVHRVKHCFGNEVKDYDYLVDIYGHLTMVTGVFTRGATESAYKTGHGKLILSNTEKVRVKDGEIYEAPAGVYVVNFMKGLVQTLAKTGEKSAQAVFGAVEFTVTSDDTVEDLCDKWDSAREKVRAGILTTYDS